MAERGRVVTTSMGRSCPRMCWSMRSEGPSMDSAIAHDVKRPRVHGRANLSYMKRQIFRRLSPEICREGAFHQKCPAKRHSLWLLLGLPAWTERSAPNKKARTATFRWPLHGSVAVRAARWDRSATFSTPTPLYKEERASKSAGVIRPTITRAAWTPKRCDFVFNRSPPRRRRRLRRGGEARRGAPNLRLWTRERRRRGQSGCRSSRSDRRRRST